MAGGCWVVLHTCDSLFCARCCLGDDRPIATHKSHTTHAHPNRHTRARQTNSNREPGAQHAREMHTNYTASASSKTNLPAATRRRTRAQSCSSTTFLSYNATDTITGPTATHTKPRDTTLSTTAIILHNTRNAHTPYAREHATHDGGMLKAPPTTL